VQRRRITALLALTSAAAVLAGACTAVVGEVAGSAPTTSTTTTTATSAAGSPTSSSSTSSSGFVPDTIQWTNCGQRLECATLRVPLDYANPTGKTIELSLNQVPARHQNDRIGSLLVNPGGPGGSGLDFVAGIDLPADLLDRFDIVGFDPRGVGASTELNCGDNTVPAFRKADPTPDTPDEQATLDATAKSVADDCGTNAGDLLPHLGTDDVVRDMNTIRQALGEDQISYLGISYGTLLGLRFAQLFPHQARAIVLDGVVDPAQDFRAFLRQQTIAFEKQIQSIFDACPSGRSDCPPGGAAAAYDEIARRVESAPIAGSSGKTLGPAELATAALIPTYDPTAVPVFYGSLTKALQGDGAPMLRLSAAYEDSVKYTLYAAVECIDSPHPVGSDEYLAFAQELEALSPRFGGAIANELLPCAFWPAPVQSIVGPVTAPDAPPILVVGTTGDSATPYEQAVTVAKTLANGHLITFQGDGHAAYGKSTCVDGAEAAYFVDLALPADGKTCTN
jgi:pimeloyl-ACP methyl ester carboxylesterase